jgi:hypothetical protein
MIARWLRRSGGCEGALAALTVRRADGLARVGGLLLRLAPHPTPRLLPFLLLPSAVFLADARPRYEKAAFTEAARMHHFTLIGAIWSGRWESNPRL